MSVVKKFIPRDGDYIQAIYMGEFRRDSLKFHEVVIFLNKYWGPVDPMPETKPRRAYSWYHEDGYFYLSQHGMWLKANGEMVLARLGRDAYLTSRSAFDKKWKEATPASENSPVAALDTMLNLQREVESKWGRLPDPHDDEAISTYLREVILCATDELHEVLAEVNWKPWKEPRGIKNIVAYREEVADVMHFILDLYLAAGLTGEDIYQDYVAKHNINIDRTTNSQYKES